MHLRDLWKEALRSLRTNLGRSALTILGIVIGVMALVLVMSLGQGAQQLILNEIESIGSDTLVVRPGREPDGPSNFADAILSDSLKVPDIAALEKVPGVRSVHPSVLVPGSVSYEDEVFRPTTIGWTATALEELFSITPIEGDYFTIEDIRSLAKVAVIGSRVSEELFGNTSPIGKTIKIKNSNVRVVGVLPERGQVSFFNINNIVLIPYSTAQRYILGIHHFHEFMVKVDNPTSIDAVVADIEYALRERHAITNPDKDDFYVETQRDLLERISTISQALTIFLSSIAAISLLVGGVGIMNIMLVSVTERTREIGLRKAVGATDADILKHFLLESLILTTTGGLLGTLIALGLSLAAASIIQSQFGLAWNFELPISAISLGIGMAAVVGLTFGLYPARQAARKSPIEALRYE